MACRGKEGAEERGLGLMVDLSQTLPSAIPQSWASRGVVTYPVDQDMVVEGSKLWPAGRIGPKLFMYVLPVKMGFAFLNGWEIIKRGKMFCGT